MGTGGSLRLLSPEISGCQGWLLARSLLCFRLSLSLTRFPFPRTLKTAQVGVLSAPDHGASFTPSTFFLKSFSLQVVRSFVVPQLPVSPLFSLNSPLSFQDQALDRLVSSSSIRYRTSTDDLSTSSSLRGLTSLRCGNSLLWGGFTLRCLQRLSRPNLATLPWFW